MAEDAPPCRRARDAAGGRNEGVGERRHRRRRQHVLDEELIWLAGHLPARPRAVSSSPRKPGAVRLDQQGHPALRRRDNRRVATEPNPLAQAIEQLAASCANTTRHAEVELPRGTRLAERIRVQPRSPQRPPDRLRFVLANAAAARGAPHRFRPGRDRVSPEPQGHHLGNDCMPQRHRLSSEPAPGESF
jgi:hypothetical protein